MAVQGRAPPNAEFLISVRLFPVNDEKRLFGRAIMAVDSRCRVVIYVRFTKEVGSDPAMYIHQSEISNSEGCS